MKIAVTYENGNVFQHFGRTEEFKVYEIQDNKVVNSEVIGNEGAGHEALAGLLADKDIKVLICGGMGQGAANALAEAGIEVYAGAAGDADECVASYLAGTLEQGGVNCDHHDHENHHEETLEDILPEGVEIDMEELESGCDCGDDCNCGGGCGGCGGGCGGGAPQIIYEGKNAGKVVRVHYVGNLDDGTQFDSSYDRGEPLTFMSGIGQMIAGFDKAVVNMNVGDMVDVHLEPEEAYGEHDPEAVLEIPLAELAGAENLKVGEQAYLQDQYGRPFAVTVTNLTEDTITLDANHELAGKALNFRIELLEVEE